MKSIKYVIKENISNVYRIFCIAKYEIVSDNRDSKLGSVWSVLDPLIQIFAYWFAFGLGIRGGKPVNGVGYLEWMLVGLAPWFFLSAAIRNGTTSIHQKAHIITKMKFPISILPTTAIVKELFTHLIMLGLVIVFFVLRGNKLSISNLTVLYYIFSGVAFTISFSMVTSVLNMSTRDVKKAINASMRLLMFATPILWTMDKLPNIAVKLMQFNPLYYIVEGYRNSLLYNVSIFSNIKPMIVFWLMTLTLFVIGSYLMYKFKQKFIDFI